MPDCPISRSQSFRIKRMVDYDQALPVVKTVPQAIVCGGKNAGRWPTGATADDQVALRRHDSISPCSLGLSLTRGRRKRIEKV